MSRRRKSPWGLVIFLIVLFALTGCSLLDRLGPNPADPCDAKPDTSYAGRDTTFTVRACPIR